MNKSMIAALLMTALPAGVLAPSVLAQSADTTYCNALSTTHDRYINANTGRSNQTPNAAIERAKQQCASDPAGSVPVLEKALKDAKVSLPQAANAAQPSSDKAYCNALSATYDRYVTNPNMGRGNQRLTASIGQAQAQCASNPAAGIPVLEKALKDARIDLPPRS